MPKRLYSAKIDYEKKLETVMARLAVEQFNYDWTRNDCFISFIYNGEMYKFTHSKEKAEEHGIKVTYVQDLFAMLVLTLEDIARAAERGTYDLQTWIEGMRYLPPPKAVPACFTEMGFEEVPTANELQQRFRELAKQAHPDTGGSEDAFQKLRECFREAKVCLLQEDR